VQSLHHDNDDAMFLRVQAAQERAEIPLVCRLAARFRKGIFGLEDVFENDHIGATTHQT